MSIVIPFAPRPHAAPSQRPALPQGAAAEILFFTGVRYERQPDPAPAEAQVLRRRNAAAARRSKRAGQPV